MPLFRWMHEWRQARRRERRRVHEQRLLDRLAEVAAEPGADSGGRVVTVVLGGKPDPLRPRRTLADFSRYIRPWWNSIHRVGLRGVILHDVLSDEFLAAHASPLVEFVRVAPGSWPLYHERHRLVRDFLTQADDEFVLITDVSDVAFRRNPFAVLRSAGPRRLGVGSEPVCIGQSRFMREEMERQFGVVLHAERPLLNPGVFGGRRERVLAVLNDVVAEAAERPASLTGTDMSLFNKVMYERFSADDWLTGHPLHSRFRGWEFDTTAAVIHK